MAIIKTLPKDARFIQTANIFEATFNNPTAGRYDFDIIANQRQKVMPINRAAIYFIDRLNFSATIPESDYLLAIDTLPVIQLFYGLSGDPVYSKPLPLVQYIDNQETNTYFSTLNRQDEEDDFITVSMRGVLEQPASLVGVQTIRAQLSLNVYEVTNQQWIKEYRQQYNEKYWPEKGLF